MDRCPCNPTKLFKECCEPFLTKNKIPQSPQELMQSRFSAYCKQQGSYLLETWHPSTRPESVDLSRSPNWLSLQIIKTSSTDDQGVVEFKATYLEGKNIGVLHETSRFTRDNDHWFYVDGDLYETQMQKAGRNEKCPCGSGRKFKKCCG